MESPTRNRKIYNGLIPYLSELDTPAFPLSAKGGGQMQFFSHITPASSNAALQHSINSNLNYTAELQFNSRPILEALREPHSLDIQSELSVQISKSSFTEEKQQIAAHLRLLGMPKQANEILSCGDPYGCVYWLWCECGKQPRPYLCNYPRICPECAIRYKNKQILKYRYWLKQFPLSNYRAAKCLRLITLTMESVLNFADGIAAIKNNFRKFRKKEVIKKALHKGLVCIQKNINKETGLYNVHIHIVAHSSYINQKVLSQEWSKVTQGKGIITDIRLCGSYKGSIGYLLQYTTKGSYETPRQKAESFIALYRQKLIYPFGLNNHDKEAIRKKKFVCKKCGVPKEYISPIKRFYGIFNQPVITENYLFNLIPNANLKEIQGGI